MGDKDKLSIIMPIYNVEDFLDKSINSVLSQNYKNMELILIDDGSTDNSGAICKKYSLRDSRIVLIRTENCGVSSARNKGLSIASGNLITFVDADDWVEPDAYEKLINWMKNNNADIGSFGSIIEEKRKSYINLKKSSSLVLQQNEAVEKLIEGEILGWYVWNKIYVRKLLKDIYFDLNITYCEDLLFNWNVFRKAHVVVFLSLYAYHYVQRSSSACHYFSKKKLSVINVFKKIMRECKDNNILYNLVKEKYMGCLIKLVKVYFSQPNRSMFKYEVQEFNYIQSNIRHEFLFFLRLQRKFSLKIAAIIVMAPMPITYLAIKLYNGLNHLFGRCRSY